MSRLIIKTGTLPNDKTGDSLFAAFNKVNANFEELYALTGGTTANLKELIQDTIAEMIANGTLFGFQHHNETTIVIEFQSISCRCTTP